MVNSLTQFQNQFGRNLTWVIAIILIIIGLFTLPVGLVWIVLAVIIIFVIKKYGRKIDKK